MIPLMKRIAQDLSARAVKPSKSSFPGGGGPPPHDPSMGEKPVAHHNPAVEHLNALYEAIQDDDADKALQALCKATSALHLSDEVAFDVEDLGGDESGESPEDAGDHDTPHTHHEPPPRHHGRPKAEPAEEDEPQGSDDE